MIRVLPSHLASACSFSTLRLNLVLTHGIPPDFRGGVHLFIPPCILGSVPSLSGHAIAYRWRSVPRVRRHRASSPQGNSSNGCCLCRSPWTNQCAPLFFHTHKSINTNAYKHIERKRGRGRKLERRLER